MLKRNKAFTLIELLVVIAIIAILAAILFPVFAQAKAAAKKTTDLSNLKQLSLAIMMFKEDNEGYYPKAWFNDEVGGQQTGVPFPFWGWDYVIQPYIKNKQLYQSQLDSESFPRGLWNQPTDHFFTNPGWVDDGEIGNRVKEDDIPASWRFNISNNDHQFTSLNESGLDQVVEAIVLAPSRPGNANFNWHQITTSIDQIAPGDYEHAGVCIDKVDNVQYDRNSPVAKTPTKSQRSQGKSSYAFADGHAAVLSWNATWKRVGEDVQYEGKTLTPNRWRQRFASPWWWQDFCNYREGDGR